VSIRAARVVAWLLVPIWLVGVASGAVHPLGLLLTAIDLPTAFCASVALCLHHTLHAGEKPRPAVAYGVGCALFVITHLVFNLVALSSAHDLVYVMEWDGRIKALIILVLLIIPLATAGLAWNLTQQMYRRFDEWADRPRRSAQPILDVVAPPSVGPPAEAAPSRGLTTAPLAAGDASV
jgi:hypothetical protein